MVYGLTRLQELQLPSGQHDGVQPIGGNVAYALVYVSEERLSSVDLFPDPTGHDQV